MTTLEWRNTPLQKLVNMEQDRYLNGDTLDDRWSAEEILLQITIARPYYPFAVAMRDTQMILNQYRRRRDDREGH